MKKRHIFCLAYLIIIVIEFILFFQEIHHTSNFIKNLITLGIFLFPIVIIIFISGFKKSTARTVSLVIASIGTIVWFLVSWFFIMFFFGSLLTNNGFHKVYEKQVNDKTLVIFRTPNEGAFGGDELKPAIVTKVFWGLEKRDWIDSGISYEYGSDSCYVVIDGKNVNVPNRDVLYEDKNYIIIK